MEVFEIGDITRHLQESDNAYLEFLRSPSLSVGLYILPKGAADQQNPHTEDEVYYVLGGSARFRAGDEDRAVQTASILFVQPGMEHRFHSIEEDLHTLVFFAPPEGSSRKDTGQTAL